MSAPFARACACARGLCEKPPWRLRTPPPHTHILTTTAHDHHPPLPLQARGASPGPHTPFATGAPGGGSGGAGTGGTAAAAARAEQQRRDRVVAALRARVAADRELLLQAEQQRDAAAKKAAAADARAKRTTAALHSLRSKVEVLEARTPRVVAAAGGGQLLAVQVRAGSRKNYTHLRRGAARVVRRSVRVCACSCCCRYPSLCACS